MKTPISEEAAAFQVGDQVKLVLDKEKSPDNQYHGQTGIIVEISFDDASSITGDSEDNFIYKVELENGEVPDIHFRRRDIVHLK